MRELSKNKYIKYIGEVADKLENFKEDTDFLDLFSNYLSEIHCDEKKEDGEETCNINRKRVPFISGLFEVYQPRIEKLIEGIASKLEQAKRVFSEYEEFTPLISGNFRLEVDQLCSGDTDLDFKTALEFCKKIRKWKLKKLTLPQRSFCGMFVVFQTKTNDLIETILYEEKAKLERKMVDWLGRQANILIGKYKALDSQLRGGVETSADLKQREDFLEDLDDELGALVQRSQVFFKKVMTVFKEKFFEEKQNSMFTYCQELRDFPHRIRSERDSCWARLKERKKTLISDLQDKVTDYHERCEDIASEFEEIETIQDLHNCMTFQDKIRKSRLKFDELQSQVQGLKEEFTILHRKEFNSSLLSSFKLKVDPYYYLWDVCLDFLGFWNKMLQSEIDEIKGFRMKEELHYINTRLTTFETRFSKSFSSLRSSKIESDMLTHSLAIRHDPSLAKKSFFKLKEKNISNLFKLKASLEKKIAEFQMYVPLLEILIETEFKKRHWEMIWQTTGKTFSTDGITAKSLYLALEDVEIALIENLAKRARKESKIEGEYESTRVRFRCLVLIIDNSNIHKRFDLLKLQEVLETVNEGLVRMGRLAKTRKKSYMHSRLDILCSLLQRSKFLLELVLETQDFMDELKAVFEGEEIRVSLPTLSNQFDQQELDFYESLKKIEVNPGLEVLVTKEIHRPTIQAIENSKLKLISIHQELEDFLEQKRLAFPRFYCLDNSKLFGVLRDFHGPDAIPSLERVLPRMFLSVHGLVRSKDRYNIVMGVKGELLILNGFVESQSISSSLPDMDHDPALDSFSQSVNTEESQEKLVFMREIEIQRFTLEEFMLKLEKSIESQIVVSVKSKLNEFFRTVEPVDETICEGLKKWVMESTGQELFICYSMYLSHKLLAIKSSCKDLKSFSTYLSRIIHKFADWISNDFNISRLNRIKFTNFICFLSRIRELTNSKIQSSSFLRDLLLTFEISKSGERFNPLELSELKQSEEMTHSNSSEHISMADIPQWKLSVRNSFFSIDFGGEFVPDLDTFALVPQNEKSFISLFNCLQRGKIGIFTGSSNFEKSLRTLAQLTGYFIRTGTLIEDSQDCLRIENLIKSSLMGGFWTGLDLSLCHDQELVSRVCLQLLLAKNFINGVVLSDNNPDHQINTQLSMALGGHFTATEFIKMASMNGKIASDRFLDQFKVSIGNNKFLTKEKMMKTFFFVNANQLNRNQLCSQLRHFWRSVGALTFKPKHVVEKLLHFKGIENFTEQAALLEKFETIAKNYSLDFLVSLRSKSFLVNFTEMAAEFSLDTRRISSKNNRIYKFFKSFFIPLIVPGQQHKLEKVLGSLFISSAPKRKVSIRNFRIQQKRYFPELLSSHFSSLETLIQGTSACIVSGDLPLDRGPLLTRAFANIGSLVFHLTPGSLSKEELFGLPLVLRCFNFASHFESDSSHFTTRTTNLNKSQTVHSKGKHDFMTLTRQSSDFKNLVNSSLKPKNGRNFLSSLFSLLESISGEKGAPIHSFLKDSGFFSLSQSLNHRHFHLIPQAERVLQMCLAKQMGSSSALRKPTFRDSNSKMSYEASMHPSQSSIQSDRLPPPDLTRMSFSNLGLLVDAPLSNAMIPILTRALASGKYLHLDGSCSFFTPTKMKCVFHMPCLASTTPESLGHLPMLHFPSEDNFTYFHSKFRFLLFLHRSQVLAKHTLTNSQTKLLSLFIFSLLHLFIICFEKILLIQKKICLLPRNLAFQNFWNLLSQWIYPFCLENLFLLKIKQSLALDRAAFALFFMTVNLSLNLSLNEDGRRVFHRHLKTLLESFFRHKRTSSTTFNFDRALLKGMKTFNLDRYVYHSNAWRVVPAFLSALYTDKTNQVPKLKDRLSSILFRNSVEHLGLSQNSLAVNSEFPKSMQSMYMLSDHNSISSGKTNFKALNGKSLKLKPFLLVPGHLLAHKELIDNFKNLKFVYKPRSGFKHHLDSMLKVEATGILSQNLHSTKKKTKTSLLKHNSDNLESSTQEYIKPILKSKNDIQDFKKKSVVKISPSSSNDTRSLRWFLSHFYTQIDRHLCKHIRAQNLQETTLTIIIDDFSMCKKGEIDFWSRLISTREIQDFQEDALQIKELSNLQIITLLPIIEERSVSFKLQNSLKHSPGLPCVPVSDYSSDQLESLFSFFIVSNILNSKTDLSINTSSLNLNSFPKWFERNLLPLCSKLYHSSTFMGSLSRSISENHKLDTLRSVCQTFKSHFENGKSINSPDLIDLLSDSFQMHNVRLDKNHECFVSSNQEMSSLFNSSNSAKNLLKHESIANAVVALSRQTKFIHLFLDFTPFIFSNDMILRIADLIRHNWIFKGNYSRLKLQHLLLASQIHSFQIINPLNPLASLSELKALLASLFEESTRLQSSKKSVILIDLRNQAESDLLFTIAQNSTPSILFSSSEHQDFVAKIEHWISFQRDTVGLITKLEQQPAEVLDQFLLNLFSFCITQLPKDVTEQKKIFSQIPRIDLESFDIPIHNSLVSLQMSKEHSFRNMLKEIPTVLDDLTGYDVMKRIVSGVGKLWNQLFGERDWVITDRIIKGTELALLDLQFRRHHVYSFYQKIRITQNEIQKLKKEGELILQQLKDKESHITLEKNNIQKELTKETQKTAAHKKILKETRYNLNVEQETLNNMNEQNQILFGALNEKIAKYVLQIQKVKQGDTFRFLAENKENASAQLLSKMILLLVQRKGTAQIIEESKTRPKFMDFLLRKKINLEARLEEAMQSNFSKRLVTAFKTYIMNDSALGKKISSKLGPIRLLKNMILTKFALEQKIQENKNFVRGLFKQKDRFQTLVMQEKQQSVIDTHLDAELEIKTRGFEQKITELKIIKKQVKKQLIRIQNAEVFKKGSQTQSKLQKVFERSENLVKGEKILFHGVLAGIYFALGYEMIRFPRLVNGLKTLFLEVCREFLFEDQILDLKQQNLAKIIAENYKIEKLFWGNHIFGFQWLSKYMRVTKCALKFFVIRDSTSGASALFKEINFKKDIIEFNSLEDLCLQELESAVLSGKMVLISNVVLKDLTIQDTTEEDCDCTKCHSLSARKQKSNLGQVSINGLMHLLKDPAQFILKASHKPSKSSTHIYETSDQDPNRSSHFQMFMFTKDQYSDFTHNQFLWENCLYEDMVETTSELEGRALLLIMETLHQSDYQEYLLNCRDIRKKMKGVKGLSEKMTQLMIDLETPILENPHKTEEFVMLRDRKMKLEKELLHIKTQNAQVHAQFSSLHTQVLLKLGQWWKLSHIIADTHHIQHITLAETLSALRKSISSGSINIRALAVSFFDKLCFSLQPEERSIFGFIVLAIAENNNPKTSLGEYIKFFKLEHSKHWADHSSRQSKPVFSFKNKMKIDPTRLYQSAACTADTIIPDVSIGSVMFPKLNNSSKRSGPPRVSDLATDTNESEKRLSTNSKLHTDTESIDNFSEDSNIGGCFGDLSGRKNQFKVEKLKSICILESNVVGLKGAFIQIKKFETQFFEWLEDFSRPIWEFNFVLEGKKVGPIEMLLILKILNIKKYLLDLKVFVGWYFSHFRKQKQNCKQNTRKKTTQNETNLQKEKSDPTNKQLEPNSGTDPSDSSKLTDKHPPKRSSTKYHKQNSNIELNFEALDPEELSSLSSFSKSHYSEGWKILEMLGQLKQNLIENIRDEAVLNNKYFLEILPQKGVPMLIKFAQHLNQQYSASFINSPRDFHTLQAEIIECIETNKWLILDLHCLTPLIFEQIEKCCRLRKSNNLSSLHTFQLFIFSDPDRGLFNQLSPQIRRKFRYFQMKIEITFTELSVLATRCFGACLMIENVPEQSIFENYIDLFISPMFGKTIHLNYEDLPKRMLLRNHPEETKRLIEQIKTSLELLLSWAGALSRKSMPFGALSEVFSPQTSRNILVDFLSILDQVFRLTVCKKGIESKQKTKKNIQKVNSSLKLAMQAFLELNIERSSQTLLNVNHQMIQEFESLNFSRELSVDLNNIIRETLTKHRSPVQIAIEIESRLKLLFKTSTRTQLFELLHQDEVPEVKRTVLRQRRSVIFSHLIFNQFRKFRINEKLRAIFYRSKTFWQSSNSFINQFKTILENERRSQRIDEPKKSCDFFIEGALDLWKNSSLKVESFLIQFKKIVLREIIHSLPKRVKIELVEIKYRILKKDVLDEFYISEYHSFNRILSILTDKLKFLIFQLSSGLEDSEDIIYLLNDKIPPLMRSHMGSHLPTHSLRCLIQFMTKQREHFRLIVESNFKLLLELRFFRQPQKLLRLAKQVTCRKHNLAVRESKEEFKIYDSPDLTENVMRDIENCQGPGYFIKGLFIVGANLHFVDQKLTKTQITETTLFAKCPLLYVCLLPAENMTKTHLKSHSMPVYKILPNLKNVFNTKPRIDDEMYCKLCLEYFFENYESLGIENARLAKFFFDLKNKLMFDSSLDLYQVLGSRKVMQNVIFNLNKSDFIF